jgi:hypothetical protein
LCISAGLGHAGWSELVSANLDYVVDGLVLHIREPARFPHAPHLLAALLTSSSVSQALLPALAEPASAAVQGLSILSRAAHPQRISAFLAALTPIAAALAGQARNSMHAAHRTLAELRSRKAAEQLCEGDVLSDDEREAGAQKESHPVNPSADMIERDIEGAGDGGFKEASEFFGGYHKPHQMVLPRDELAELDRRRWTAYAAAELSAAIANAAAPLLVAEDLKVALGAHQTVAVRLSADSNRIQCLGVFVCDVLVWFRNLTVRPMCVMHMDDSQYYFQH